MARKNLLPKMISVSRNCGFTLELHNVLSEKLTDYEIELLSRWLQIVEDERTIEANRHKFRIIK